MARTQTNNFGLAYAVETVADTQPTAGWRKLEPNTITRWGATTTKVARQPISKDRQTRKGEIVDLDSGVEFSADLTMNSFYDFMAGFCGSTWNGALSLAASAVTSSGYVVSADGDDIIQGALVVGKGWANAENNGLNVVGGSSTGTLVDVTGLVAETAVGECLVQEAGYRGATGDIEINASGNLISTSLDFEDLPLLPGMMIKIGGTAAGTRFATAANNAWARVVSIDTNEVVLDKRTATFSTDDGSGKTIDIYYGRLIKLVSVDDSDYQDLRYWFEGSFEDLASVGVDEYEYPASNKANQITFRLPLTDKAVADWAFVGKDTAVPTSSRATGASTALDVKQGEAMNTSSDIARLRIQEADETGLTTDFKSLSLTLNNQVTPEKVLAQLGARYLNQGNLLVNIEAQLVFTEGDVVAAIRTNDTVTMDFIVRNDQGAIAVDLPHMTLDGGGKDFPVNESILLNTTALAHREVVPFNTSLLVTLLAFAPSS